MQPGFLGTGLFFYVRSWASGLRYHDDVFYASTLSYTSGRTHTGSTRGPDRGP